MPLLENKTAFVRDGKPGEGQEITPQVPGQLGAAFIDPHSRKQWQKVKLVDATAVANGLVYWKDEALFEVTPTIGNSNRNRVAGVTLKAFTLAAGAFIEIQKKGSCAVKSETSATTAGTVAVAHTANNAIAGVAEGTAPTALRVGTVLANRDGTAGTTLVDLELN